MCQGGVIRVNTQVHNLQTTNFNGCEIQWIPVRLRKKCVTIDGKQNPIPENMSYFFICAYFDYL